MATPGAVLASPGVQAPGHAYGNRQPRLYSLQPLRRTHHGRPVAAHGSCSLPDSTSQALPASPHRTHRAVARWVGACVICGCSLSRRSAVGHRRQDGSRRVVCPELAASTAACRGASAGVDRGRATDRARRSSGSGSPSCFIRTKNESCIPSTTRRRGDLRAAVAGTPRTGRACIQVELARA